MKHTDLSHTVTAVYNISTFLKKAESFNNIFITGIYEVSFNLHRRRCRKTANLPHFSETNKKRMF